VVTVDSRVYTEVLRLSALIRQLSNDRCSQFYRNTSHIIRQLEVIEFKKTNRHSGPQMDLRKNWDYGIKPVTQYSLVAHVGQSVLRLKEKLKTQISGLCT
jgi:hypothetical protein